MLSHWDEYRGTPSTKTSSLSLSNKVPKKKCEFHVLQTVMCFCMATVNLLRSGSAKSHSLERTHMSHMPCTRRADSRSAHRHTHTHLMHQKENSMITRCNSTQREIQQRVTWKPTVLKRTLEEFFPNDSANLNDNQNDNETITCFYKNMLWVRYGTFLAFSIFESLQVLSSFEDAKQASAWHGGAAPLSQREAGAWGGWPRTRPESRRSSAWGGAGQQKETLAWVICRSHLAAKKVAGKSYSQSLGL